jgi:hypothetical protein
MLILFSTNSFGKKKLEIYLNFNECITCFSALSSLELIPDIEKIMYISKSDSLVSMEFLSGYDLPRDVQFRYLNGKAKQLSFCVFSVNDAVIDSFPLKILPGKINSMLGQTKKSGSKCFNLPKNIVLKNDRMEVFIRNNFVSIYDYILNKNYLFELDLNKDTLINSSELKGSQFPPKIFLQLGKFDSILYYSLYSDLKKLGKGAVHIESSFISDSALHLLLNFPFVFVSPNNINDTVIDMSFFHYEKNLFTQKKSLSFIHDERFSKKYNYRFFLNNSKPFFMQNRVLYSGVSDEKKSDSIIFMFAKWKQIANKAFTFDEFDGLNITKDYFTKNYVDSFPFIVNTNFYFNTNLKFIYDYGQERMLFLNNLFLKENEAAIDITRDEKMIKVLILTGKSVDVLTINAADNKLINRVPQNLPENCVLSSVKFFSTQDLIYINRSNTKIFVTPAKK